jgi:RNA polymerase sigma factor (sigma-70 family)
MVAIVPAGGADIVAGTRVVQEWRVLMSETQQKSKPEHTFRSDEVLDPPVKEGKDTPFLWPRRKVEPDEKLLAPAHLTYEGEVEKIAEWIRRYQTSCRALAFKVVQDYDGAEDVVQNAFVKAFLAFRRYPPQKRETLQVQPWLQKIVFNEAHTYLASKREYIPIDDDEGRWVDEIEGLEHDRPEVRAINEEEKHLFDDLLMQVSVTSREVLEHWLRWAGSYPDMAKAFDCDIKTVRTRFHRAVQRLKKIVSDRNLRESDLRQWLQAYQLVLEEEWLERGWEKDRFSLREYLQGEAYANRFGGHPVRWQFMPEDDWVPDAFLPPSYWN